MMHLVYELLKDPSYQYLGVVDESSDVYMNGYPKGSSWVPPRFYNPLPLLQKPDFYDTVGALILNERARIVLGAGFLESASEVLPIICDEPHCPDENLYIVNVLNCVNCLDHDKTVWQDERRIHIVKPVFRQERLPLSGNLFKIPEKVGTRIYFYLDTQTVDPFKEPVEKAGLRGLIFNEVWRSE